MNRPTINFSAITVAFIFSLASLNVFADVRLPALFSDHMVLQANERVPVWGWAKPNEKVSVAIAGQKLMTVADVQGRWRVRLEPIQSGQHLTLTVQGANKITVNDVLTGEIWLGSGQSNMQMKVREAKDFSLEQTNAEFPDLRMFTVPLKASLTPLEDTKGSWRVCNSNTVGEFSAMLYFFGREIHQRMKTPVGLIHSSWGGTPIQSWTSLEAQARVTELKPIVEGFQKALQKPFDVAAADAEWRVALTNWQAAVADARAKQKDEPRKPLKRADPRVSEYSPGNLFNAMVAPLIPYRIKGALWYQGEANGGLDKAPLYRHQLPTLINDWRARWGESDFPFAWAQLPGFTARTNDPAAPSGWALVREGMLETLSLPNTGMGVNIDLGEEKNIHPKNKQDVGHRLALWALAQVYQQKIPFSGPLFVGSENLEGKIKLKFSNADGGLVCRNGVLKGFAIAGADKKWRWAEAQIDGDNVVVSSGEVPQPVAVRYGWANNPDCNLYNSAGLPASPFRTDRW